MEKDRKSVLSFESQKRQHNPNMTALNSQITLNPLYFSKLAAGLRCNKDRNLLLRAEEIAFGFPFCMDAPGVDAGSPAVASVADSDDARELMSDVRGRLIRSRL